ncbi:hypothetical protein Chro_4291 [Chroococcidiopsis thermalis PCC 7203]|jgi:hypothetical protein|uniref:Uncharacterized protein n=1 Tax=Chroococcidiopsis thermalis (strain PCC 7203) TaxID=251229 RepID=K9U4X5_CHRTP|nr:hypothetical protein [Chroococcidiopsis thermalis]AFY89688.1 hypothetical protein Chro_4291 [Chroococcidiopsis thermalis PCC 7203]
MRLAIAMICVRHHLKAKPAIDSNPQKTSALPMPNQSDGISCRTTDANNTANIGSSSNIAVASTTGKRCAAIA